MAIGLADDCRVWYAGENSVVAASDFRGSRIENIDLMSDDVGGIRITVPENACRWLFRGRVVDSTGDGVAGARLRLEDERLARIELQAGADGSFSTVVPLPSRYRLQVLLDDCRPYYESDRGVAFERGDASALRLGEGNVTGLVVEVPDDVCEKR